MNTGIFWTAGGCGCGQKGLEGNIFLQRFEFVGRIRTFALPNTELIA